MRALGPVLAVLVVIALLASSAMYTVDQRQNAIVFQLGEAREIVKEPGLHFKWPLLQNVRGEPVMVPHWVRGREEASLPTQHNQRIVLTALGGSVATPANGITTALLPVKPMTSAGMKRLPPVSITMRAPTDIA